MYQIFQSHARSFQWFLYIMGMWKILLMKPSENCWRQDSILDGQLDAGIVMQRPVENALVQIEREILIASILAQLQTVSLCLYVLTNKWRLFYLMFSILIFYVFKNLWTISKRVCIPVWPLISVSFALLQSLQDATSHKEYSENLFATNNFWHVTSLCLHILDPAFVFVGVKVMALCDLFIYSQILCLIYNFSESSLWVCMYKA